MSDVLPPPPLSRSSDGCWKWGAITCGGLGCLGIIGLFALGYFVIKSPEFQKAMKQMTETTHNASIAQRDMTTIKRALDHYKTDKGKYPSSLEDLVPKYLPSEKSLHLSAEPNGPEFFYTPPSKDAPPSATVLQYDLPAPVPAPDAPPWTIKMRLDGTFEGLDYRYRGRSIGFSPGGQ